MYKIARVKLKSVSPFSPSKPFESEKPQEQSHGEFDEQHWREHAEINAEGHVCIAAMSLKKAIDTAAKHLGEKVPGARGSTYTAKFERGMFIQTPLDLGITREQLTIENSVRIYADSMGKKDGKGGARVWRRYPLIHQWTGILEIHIVEPSILIKSEGKSETDLLERHIEAAGLFIGVGRFRPQNGGFNGRFAVDGPVKLTEVVGKQ